jgi:hypothetical protein
MWVTDRMRNRRGSAIVLAILLLVLLNAIGMYAVSLTGSVAEGQQPHYQAAAAKNMARAGAHAAVARLPEVFPHATPYVRRMAIGPGMSGRYSVTSRRAGEAQEASGNGIVFEDYAIISEGTASGYTGGTVRVRAEVRVGRISAGQSRGQAPGFRARILKWEESGR